MSTAPSGEKLMRSNLAVFLDENIERGGELQIRRHGQRGGFGSEWNLILWTPLPGSDFPRARLRLRAHSAHSLIASLDTWVQELQEREREEQEQAAAVSPPLFAPAPAPA